MKRANLNSTTTPKPLKQNDSDSTITDIPPPPQTTASSSTMNNNNNRSTVIIKNQISERQPNETTRLLSEDSEMLQDDTKPLLEGHSSVLHASANSINVMTGMGILALPFAFSQSGWVFGISFILGFAVFANFTSKLMGECLNYLETKRAIQNIHVPVTYSDIGNEAFGKFGSRFISICFFLELFAANTALVIVIADSLVAIFPKVLDVLTIKIVTIAILTPVTLLKNLRFLSYTSILGILALVLICSIVIGEGAISRESPGSWLNPAETDLWPRTYLGLGLSMGLILVGYDAHSIWPSIFRDLSDRSNFSIVMNNAYSCNSLMYFSIAACGYLMFGIETLPQITLNLPTVPGFWPFLTTLTLASVALNSFTKYPLITSPLLMYLESVHESAPNYRATLAFLLNAMVLLTSIIIPSFHKIMGLLGAAFSVIIALVFPPLCYLRIFSVQQTGNSIPLLKKCAAIFIATFGVLIGTYGTIGTIAQEE